MTATIILWSHALAALLFAGLALSQLRDGGASVPRTAFLVALGLTALWALATAGIGSGEAVTWVAESLRNLGWLGFMFALVRRDPAARRDRAVKTIYGVVALVALVGAGLAMLQVSVPADLVASVAAVRTLLRMMIAVGSLVLVNHLYSVVAPASRGGIRLAVIALATMWLNDFVLYTAAYLGNGWPLDLIAARGVVMVALVPVLAIAVHRNGDWTLKISRTVTWQSLTLVALSAYALATVLAISAIETFGGAHARVAQTAFVFGSAAALLTLLSSPAVKAWMRVMVAKHLFRHRYDYRAEWVRFTETLGTPGEGAPPLEARIVKAVADLTDSPGGLLLVADGGVLSPGATWQWMGGPPASAAGDELAAFLADGGRIVELDSVRAGRVAPAELAAVPQWMLDDGNAWALVPLLHVNALIGAILLARPPVDRSLDWEDFDLLRIAGRQVASYLAEARAHDQLADARRFDEFNRRFAFILHDVKNLVSQLTLVARNAERHADNPDFRADMVATLKDSAGRMNDLLARLSQHHSRRVDEPVAVELLPLVERVARRHGGGHPVVVSGERGALAMADPVRLEQALGHLIQNAVEASSGGEPVTVAVARGSITVADGGAGMSAGFVRDHLFRPFVSTKPGGFGIGAFEARQVVQAMGGTLDVVSREGEGTRFTIALPAAIAAPGLERAA
ncbi:XrtA/PEP-CTERM system histidine kinase PrsK [Sphingomonas sp.]|jgi:putative PEP-CTERM system histidine kinase|uniref:XrtA/PEP-CTERM system histidine kinase PrsK n=1 Tax=Sphingomonas sp. TaxID=28214 RepID=UPI002E31D2D3|nr:XrtA/PEP-CTERM system histidine kinase PrsK [Sphingomonas sp.]HEX4694987.1 XrtA/PEP-CTERM system histidine kinase PrsK [Sphingomonas sp.]